LVVGYLSGLFALGCALAILFEVQGFGAEQDQGPRPLYLIALALGFVLCIAALPLTRSLLARWQTPNRRTKSDL
jgi:cytochrome c biogenesis protein CcdA